MANKAAAVEVIRNKFAHGPLDMGLNEHTREAGNLPQAGRDQRRQAHT